MIDRLWVRPSLWSQGRAGLFFSVVSLLCSVSSLAQAAPVSRAPFSWASAACTRQESWKFGRNVPARIIERLTRSGESQEEILQNLVQGYRVQGAPQTEEVKNLALYVVYKAYLDLGIWHFAYRGLNAIANKPPQPEIDGIRLAALGCLNQVHRKYSTLKLPPQLTTAFANTNINGLWPTQRNQIWEAGTSIVHAKYAEAGPSADVKAGMHLLESSPLHMMFSSINLAALKGNDLDVINLTQTFLKNKHLPSSLNQHRDQLQLNMARSYYNQGNFGAAEKEFKKIARDSNHYIDSLIGLGWSTLLMKNYVGAVSAADNMMFGELNNTFAVDAPMIGAIALFENCQYAHAQEVIKFFRKTYDPAYQWLYQWYSRYRKTGQDEDLYSKVIAMLEKKKNGVPLKITTEWVKSSLFFNAQQEINLLLDEEKSTQELLRMVKQYHGQGLNSKREVEQEHQIQAAMLSMLQGFLKEIPDARRSLVQRINHELGFINRYLMSQWIATWNNLQALGADIYSTLGESIFKKPSDKAHAKHTETEVYRPTQKDEEGLPIFNWGKFEDNSSQDSEIWSDELGSLQSKITNVCGKKAK